MVIWSSPESICLHFNKESFHSSTADQICRKVTLVNSYPRHAAFCTSSAPREFVDAVYYLAYWGLIATFSIMDNKMTIGHTAVLCCAYKIPLIKSCIDWFLVSQERSKINVTLVHITPGVIVGNSYNFKFICAYYMSIVWDYSIFTTSRPPPLRRAWEWIIEWNEFFTSRGWCCILSPMEI